MTERIEGHDESADKSSRRRGHRPRVLSPEQEEILRKSFRENPNATLADHGRLVGISPKTALNYKRRFIAGGEQFPPSASERKKERAGRIRAKLGELKTKGQKWGDQSTIAATEKVSRARISNLKNEQNPKP